MDSPAPTVVVIGRPEHLIQAIDWARFEQPPVVPADEPDDTDG